MDDVADLKPTQALAMQYNIAKKFAVFIDHEDQRYNKKKNYITPGSEKTVNLFAINESAVKKAGKVTFSLINSKGKTIFTKTADVAVDPFGSQIIPVKVSFPSSQGGYLIKTELIDSDEDKSALKQVSIRYLRVGNIDSPEFYNYTYIMPKMQ